MKSEEIERNRRKHGNKKEIAGKKRHGGTGADTGRLIKHNRRHESSCSDVTTKNTCVRNPNLWLSLLVHQERKAEQAFKAQSKLKTIPLRK